MNKKERSCKIIRENSSVRVKSVGKNLLGVHISLNKPIPRKERELAEKCLKREKIKVIWGNKCLVVK